MLTLTQKMIPTLRCAFGNEMIAFVLMAVVPFTSIYPFFVMQALYFALFACAFSLLIGYGGLLSFGHSMFLGTAGYFTAHALKVWGVSPEVGIIVGIVGIVGAAALSMIAGLIVIRRLGIYFAMIWRCHSSSISSICRRRSPMVRMASRISHKASRSLLINKKPGSIFFLQIHAVEDRPVDLVSFAKHFH
jgi:ABC-type branched-subunit amino acid transport system permease subunit